MKKIFFIFLFILTISASFGQQKSNDFTLTLNFIPSFITSSKLVIEARGDSAFLNIHIRSYPVKGKSTDDRVIIPTNRLTPLLNFLSTYNFPVPIKSVDTTGLHPFLTARGDSALEVSGMFFDGTFVYGYFAQNEIKHGITFTTPQNGTQNAKLMSIIFDLLNNAFTKQNSIDYIDHLLLQFSTVLEIKKLSDDPLTYKVWGTIMFNDNDEFYTLLKNLPKHKKVIIDVSRGAIARDMFHYWLKELRVKKENLYWLNPSLGAFIDLHFLDIPEKQIISNKKLIVKKNENGANLFSLEDK